MGNTFNQTNNTGSIGTQGQVGDNHQTNNFGSRVLEPLIEELNVAVEGKEWDQETPIEITESYDSPQDLVDDVVAVAEVQVKKNVSEQEQESTAFSDVCEKLKWLLPLGVKLASSAAIGVLTSYSPVSPVLAAISKTLIQELEEK